jgi:hypothetical protein
MQMFSKGIDFFFIEICNVHNLLLHSLRVNGEFLFNMTIPISLEIWILSC